MGLQTFHEHGCLGKSFTLHHMKAETTGHRLTETAETGFTEMSITERHHVQRSDLLWQMENIPCRGEFAVLPGVSVCRHQKKMLMPVTEEIRRQGKTESTKSNQHFLPGISAKTLRQINRDRLRISRDKTQSLFRQRPVHRH